MRWNSIPKSHGCGVKGPGNSALITENGLGGGEKTAFPLHQLSHTDSPYESRICDVDFLAKDVRSRSKSEGLDWLP